MKNSDHLTWWEGVPLALAAVSQSVVVGQWYYRSIDLGVPGLNILVAVLAGLALDAIVVVTVMGRRIGRESAWSFWAALSAFVCSALIAVDMYSDWLVAVRPLLHVSYPLMVLLESQHLATAKKPLALRIPVVMEQAPAGHDRNIAQTLLETLPERSSEAERAEVGSDATPTNQAFLDELLATVSEDAQTPQATVLEPLYTCEHCGSALASKQAKGSAARFGCNNVACPGRANRKVKVVRG